MPSDQPTETPSQTTAQSGAYQVLARKYRPSDFTALVGQDAMVTTLANAMAAGRLAHAFVLTGVRGVGKTTTARIIAKGLNCQTSDGPTTEPCGVCESCVAISESRHVDVLEMDAASRTGVDDVREIIENVRYAPVSARFKVYIIDEVHMLSNNAFNALLKTLEEPPEHAKFIFATTEIRKVPVTVLSRCQRFDLRRVEGDVLTGHLKTILGAEGASADDEALAMITRAAEGSVRDSLSLLDQALAHGAGTITATQVRDMLGYADRGQIFDLMREVMSGDVEAALMRLRTLYDRGSEPSVVISDLMEITHALTRVKVAPDLGSDALLSEDERSRAADMAKGLSMPHLTRAWQMLMKGLAEVRTAPSAISAAEMVLVRLAYAADLPDPATLVKQIQAGAGGTSVAGPGSAAPAHGGAGGGASGSHGQPVAGSAQTTTATTAAVSGQRVEAKLGPGQATAQVISFRQPGAAGEPAKADVPQFAPMPQSFEDLVALLRSAKEAVLAVELKDRARLVSYAPGRVELGKQSTLRADITTELKLRLRELTGQPWTFSYSDADGDSSLQQQQQQREADDLVAAQDHPLVRAVMKAFPSAALKKVKTLAPDLALPGPGADGDITADSGFPAGSGVSDTGAGNGFGGDDLGSFDFE